ncbi:cell surface glycoprotein 1-like [Cyprinodon tularosa]|uniref:cell surface glycoprotein 1-like n=1 Tax=Cyprinodon tularosa TaxID=77115 RepID=UPI0018E1E0DF|nr:cell surface glycoprotein 1-like [Cyprinodon tularosa]XP_038137551.1 cell surface glycoprotein 1-like [Cyprinodon tularosa]
MALPSSLSCYRSTVCGLTDRGTKPLTNDEICEMIAARVAEFRSSREYALFNNRTPKQTDPLLQLDSGTSHSSLVPDLHTSVSSKDDGSKLTVSPSAFENSRSTEATQFEDRENPSTSQNQHRAPSCDPVRSSGFPSDMPTPSDTDGDPGCFLEVVGEAAQDLSQLSDLTLGSDQHNPTKTVPQTQPNDPEPSYANGSPPFPLLTDPQYEDISDAEEPSKQCPGVGEGGNQLHSTGMGSSRTLENEPGRAHPEPGPDGEASLCNQDLAEVPIEPDHPTCEEMALEEQYAILYEPGSTPSDEEDEDDWEVIPVSMLDLSFDPLDRPASAEELGEVEQNLCLVPQPVPASAFSQMAVFDTPDDQEQAVRFGQLSMIIPACQSPKTCSDKESGDAEIIDLLGSDDEDDKRCESECQTGSVQRSSQSTDSGSECILLEEEDRDPKDEGVVIIVSDSEDDVDHRGGNQAGSGEPGPAPTDSAEPQHGSQPEHRVPQSDGPSGEDQPTPRQSSEPGRHPEKVLVPKKKKQKSISRGARRSSDSALIPRLFDRNSTSNELVTLVGASEEAGRDLTGPSQSPRTTSVPPKEKHQLLRRGCTASSSSVTSQSQKKPASRIMHASQNQYQRSLSFDGPSAPYQPFTLARLPSAPVQSGQGLSHAKSRIFDDWKRQHVPLRKERRNKKKGRPNPL